MMRRPMALAAACLAAAAVGVAGASALTGHDDVVPQSPVLVAGSDSIDATAPDPVGGPAWAARVSRSESGGDCLEVGRYDGRDFGRLDPDGRVAALPVEEGGSCGDVEAEPALLVLQASPARPGQEARTVLAGLTRPGATVTVTGPGGTEVRPEVGARGAFVVAVDGFHPVPAFTVDVRLADGTLVHREL